MSGVYTKAELARASHNISQETLWSVSVMQAEDDLVEIVVQTDRGLYNLVFSSVSGAMAWLQRRKWLANYQTVELWRDSIVYKWPHTWHDSKHLVANGR
jgi:hypothetical protein